MALAACDRATPLPLFELLPPAATGVAFTNDVREDTNFHFVNYLYFYNGGGVAAGDVNNDGLSDLYFTSNLGGNRLYLNRGNYRFEDVTDRAGVGGTDGWTSGVTMADVDADGYLDIYVSGVSYLAMRGRNVLYLNNRDGTFRDATQRFGLEHVGYSTQAAFFDADGDGDLDMYLLNASVHSDRGPSSSPQRHPRHPRAGDRLFRNDGDRFVDVSDRAGIYGGVEGYGLGVVASDFNLDGCIDLFVANDFQENDFLYYNNCDGTFRESIATSMGHTSRSSMGVDAADINNDAKPDLVVLDMLPEREDILKTSANAESHELLDLKTRAGYHPQYARNTLQLNRGAGVFSEIGYLAGMYATDWSWTPLLADFDNDGRKDLFVTNGIYRRPNDLDYISFVSQRSVQAVLARGRSASSLSLLQRMPHVPLANHAYRNNGDFTFTNVADAWGIGQPGFSNGAVYVDLNNSGALDLVVSNINAPASIYRNRARAINQHHFLRVDLRGTRESGNPFGIGAKVIIRHGDTRQMLELMPTRGFQSAVDPRLHFGLGASTQVDSLLVVWPDGRFQVLTGVRADQTMVLDQTRAAGRFRYDSGPSAPALFVDETAMRGIDFRHRENAFVDFDREPLMPHLLSTEGPALAVGDVNADSLDDLFVGGARGQAGRLLVQRPDGRFQTMGDRAFEADSAFEDVDAAFFDADGDGDMDLYVVSGGNEFQGEHELLQDRLYLNDGQGALLRSRDALPAISANGGTVAPGDLDGDGDIDLFVGSRSVPGQYGVAPRSRLLENDGRGRFRDVTVERAPSLAEAGMVTDAAWLDVDADGRLDLIVVGEWMPVGVYLQRNGRFEDRTARAGLAGSNGWWNSLTVSDVNGDGRQDLVLGNLGLNSYIKASPTQPARLYLRDFGSNGTLEQILTFYKGGVSYPIAGRDEITRSIASLRSRYPTYGSFGASRVEDLFTPAELRQARVLEARTFATSVALSDGKGAFTLKALPAEAQFAPVYASVVHDFDGDGRTDILLAGNLHGVPPVRGRYDASHGLLLRGDGAGTFTAVAPEESRLLIEGQVRDLQMVRSRRGVAIAVARNNETLQLLRPIRTPHAQGGPR